MKTYICFFIFCLLLITPGYSQLELWGTTSWGGDDNLGTIYRIVGDDHEVVHHFRYDREASLGVNGELNEASDGRLYGVVTCRASLGAGLIISYDPSTSSYTEDIVIPYEVGTQPDGTLVEYEPGMLIGVCRSGGINDAGTIFTVELGAGVVQKVFDMNPATGGEPMGGFVRHTNGQLFGVTRVGGTNDVGVIYRFDPTSTSYMILHEFSSSDGTGDVPTLTEAENGRLYGVRAMGGDGPGTLFSTGTSQGQFIKHLDFVPASGSRPQYPLIIGPNGDLFGVTTFGWNSVNGTVFKFSPSTNDLTHFFTCNTTGSESSIGSPLGAPHFTSTGDVLVHAESVSVGNQTFSAKRLHFNGDDLSLMSTYAYDGKPSVRLTTANDGNTYGIDRLGRYGIKMYPVTEGPIVVVPFNIRSEGAYPGTYLTMTAGGKLLGSCGNGGDFDNGMIFSFDPLTSEYNLIHSFLDPDQLGRKKELIEVAPNVHMMIHKDLLLRIDHQQLTLDTVFDLSPFSGQHANGVMSLYGNDLYIATRLGGDHGWGSILKYDIQASSIDVLYSFGPYLPDMDAYSESMEAPLLMADGNLIGIFGYADYYIEDSYIYKLDPNAGTIQIIANSNSYDLRYKNIIKGDGNVFYVNADKESVPRGSYLLRINSDNSVEELNFIPDIRSAGRSTLTPDGNIYGCGTTFTHLQTIDIIYRHETATGTTSIPHSLENVTGRNLLGGMLATSLGVGFNSLDPQYGALHVYPNPAQNVLFCDHGLAGQVELIIYDSHGRMQSPPWPGMGRMSIDVSSLANGVYIAMLLEKGLPVSRARFVIAR